MIKSLPCGLYAWALIPKRAWRDKNYTPIVTDAMNPYMVFPTRREARQAKTVDENIVKVIISLTR